jgi:hypothetical protein
MRTFSRTVGALAIVLCANAAGAQQAGDFLKHARIERAGSNVTLTTNDPRPLQQAVDAVAEEYGWTIDYEDPPYRSAFDLADDTSPAWRAANPAGKGVTRVRGGLFRTAYRETPATPVSSPTKANLLRKIVDDYNKTENPGRFAVRENSGRISVVGMAVKDSNGSRADTSSVLDTTIAVRGTNTTAAIAVKEILEAVGARSKVKVLTGTLPTNLLVTTAVKLSGGERSARAALNDVLSQASIDMSWRLLYDADSQAYYLNLLLAKRAHYDMAGNRQLILIRKR